RLPRDGPAIEVPLTAQFSDQVRFAEAEWALAGANGTGLFEPSDHGVTVRVANTACWRGFVCTYAVSDGLLTRNDRDGATDGSLPRLFGWEPRGKNLPLGFTDSYRSMGGPGHFTGGLLIARNFLQEHYVHMGFHPAWKYADVVEIEFDTGRV